MNRTESVAEEHRQHPRVSLSATVDLSSGANFFVGRTRDISLGGIFIETTASIAAGMPLNVKLELFGKPVTAKAEVVWVLLDKSGAPSGAGIRFLDLSPEARKAIEAFMIFRAPMEVHEDHED